MRPPLRHQLRLCCVLLIAAVGMAAEGGTATLGLSGQLRIAKDGDEICSFAPVAADPSWQFAKLILGAVRQEGPVRRFALDLKGKAVQGEGGLVAREGKAEATWTFTAAADLDLACLAVSADLPAAAVMGGRWSADDANGTFPAVLDKMQLFNGKVKRLTTTTAAGRTLTIDFPTPTTVLIQDNRKWGQSFSLRLGSQGGRLAKGARQTLAMTVGLDGGLTTAVDGPVVIAAGDEWVPLTAEQEVEPGSALDLSAVVAVDAPCGRLGRVVATPAGHFAFAQDPQRTPRRFYGVNLCFSANFLPSEQIDRLCDRFLRLGYNSLRIHHYEGGLTDNKPGFDWNPAKLDQLDRLLAACGKRGIWVTTDLYVSRPVSAEQVQMPDGKSWAYRYKVLVPVHEPAFKDWETFTRKLLDHVNPHSGKRWADDPTLAWLSLINEGNFGNYWDDVKSIPQWTTAWNVWLKARYADRAALAAAWGSDLAAAEDAAAGSVKLPGGVHGDSPRHRDCHVFLAATERAMTTRMTRFLRDELKCQALITNMNAWTNHSPNQWARELYDYVDDHFYVDHPEFIERDWRLPSRCGNQNPVRGGATGGRGNAPTRLYGKPFTISEYNYSSPGRFRGVGGILTGALGALQDWDALWRFGYSHVDKTMFQPSPMSYFDLVGDPLNLAADRAAVMLYLRGDLAPAPHQVALVMTPAELQHPRGGASLWSAPGWSAWVTRLGTALVDDPASVPKDAVALPLGWTTPAPKGLAALASEPAALLAVLKERGIVAAGNPTDPARNILQSETGEILIDGPRGVLRFDTPRTAGGYADPGQTITAAKAGVHVTDLDVGATVFVTSLDRQPIRTAPRLLVTHLTDLQNTGTTYAEAARQTLLEWGKLPHLVRTGSATVRIALADAKAYKVWALTTAGRRLEQIPATVGPDGLTFTVRVKAADGARLVYEVATK